MSASPGGSSVSDRLRTISDNVISNVVWLVMCAAAAGVVVAYRYLGTATTAVLAVGLSLLLALLSLWLWLRRRFAELRADVAVLVDWTFDQDEHRQEVYAELKRLVENPRVRRFYVTSLLNPPTLNSRLSNRQRVAMEEYYGACEKALTERELDYRRMVIFRRPLAGTESDAATRTASTEHTVCEILGERTEFRDHCKRMASSQLQGVPPSVAEFRYFIDEGRLVDTALALAMDDKGRAVALVIEIGLTARVAPDPGAARTEPARQAMALLIIRHPKPEIERAFSEVFFSLYNTRFLKPVDNIEHLLTDGPCGHAP